MAEKDALNNLEKVLEKAASAGDGNEDVSVSQLMGAVGRRSFGPVLLVISLIAFTPLGGVPGIPTLLAGTILLVAVQLLVGADHFWLPRFVLRRSVKRQHLRKSINFIMPAARIIDRVLKTRLEWVFQPFSVRIAALICILILLTIPPLEIVPFAGTVPWLAVVLFALSLIARDGLIAMVALIVALGGGYMVVTLLLV